MAARLFQAYLRNPGETGSVVASGGPLSRAMAEAARAALVRHHEARLVELGPGTGSITRYITDLQPLLIEKDPELYGRLVKRHPDLEIVNEDAACFLRHCRRGPLGLISSIPLIGNQNRSELVTKLGETYLERRLSFLVLYTYGAGDPLPEIRFRHRRRSKRVIFNVPPATVWVFE